MDIRKRMGGEQFDIWNELIIEKADSLKPKKERNINKDRDSDRTTTENKGTLKIDATVADQKINRLLSLALRLVLVR